MTVLPKKIMKNIKYFYNFQSHGGERTLLIMIFMRYHTKCSPLIWEPISKLLLAAVTCILWIYILKIIRVIEFFVYRYHHQFPKIYIPNVRKWIIFIDRFAIATIFSTNWKWYKCHLSFRSSFGPLPGPKQRHHPGSSCPFWGESNSWIFWVSTRSCMEVNSKIPIINMKLNEV